MRLDRRRSETLAIGALAAGALASTFASLGHLSWWLELFTHFRPQYAAWLVACCVILLWLRRPGLAVAALALAAVNTLPLAHYRSLGPERPPAAGPEFSAVLLNVFAGSRDHDRVLAYVREARPDVAVFLEVTPAWNEALRRLEDVLPYQAWSGEIFVASREPVAGLRGVPLTGRPGAAVVFGAAAGGVPLVVIGAHAGWPLGRRAAAARNDALDALAVLARSTDGPLLVLADLNTTAYSPSFRRLLAHGGLGDCAAGRGLHATWPALFPPLYIQIDHCLHGPGLEVARIATGPFVGSDHYPLEVTVRHRLVPARSGPGLTAALELPTSRR